VGLKVELALAGGLKVIPCFGEMKEQRESGKYMETIIAQLEPIVAAVPKVRAVQFIICWFVCVDIC
jgi:triosephosphate isomerase